MFYIELDDVLENLLSYCWIPIRLIDQMQEWHACWLAMSYSRYSTKKKKKYLRYQITNNNDNTKIKVLLVSVFFCMTYIMVINIYLIL